MEAPKMPFHISTSLQGSLIDRNMIKPRIANTIVLFVICMSLLP